LWWQYQRGLLSKIMVLNYYKLREEPFGVTPDSRYLYASATHREALASVLYGLEAGRGFVALIAKPGMGKTTLLFHGLNRLREKARTVFLFQTICTPTDFLRALLADLGVHETQGSLTELQAKLNEVVAEQSLSGKPLVVVVDEAQNLDSAVLELVRMLSNFETSREKLIQIILSGQPQLAEKLASPELVQLRQRVSIVARLKPLSPKETALYIDHRLRVAGYSAEIPLFTGAALALIADRSEGIPRNINNLCFNALSLGCALRRETIDDDIVREVIADLDLEPLRERRSRPLQPEKEEAREAPVFATAASARSGAAWLSRLAVAAMILLVITGALFESLRLRNDGSDRSVTSVAAVRSVASVASDASDAQEATVLAASVVPPPVPVVTSSVPVDVRPQPEASAGTIRVTAGKTLYRICVESFGRCNPEHLQEIRRLNPWLSNPDHIESGERIRIPGSTENLIGQAGSASPAEKDAQ
jgi:general secretion pathway protein A